MELNPAALEAVRTYAGFSQAELARRSGLSQGHISELERGDKRPRPATLKKLAETLSVPMVALLYEPGPNGARPSENRRDAGRRINGAGRRRTNGTRGPDEHPVKARQPVVGDPVLFRPDPTNATLDDTMVPAVVLRTMATCMAAAAQKPTTSTKSESNARPAPGRSTPLPPELVTVLPNDWTVDLVVFGLVESYRVYRVPHGEHPGCWCWPNEHPTLSPRRSSGDRRREPSR